MLSGWTASLRRHRRHVAVVAVFVALAGGIVMAHSAIAADHMGDAMAVCLAITETAAVGAFLLVGGRFGRPGRFWVASLPCDDRSATRPGSALPAARGSPFALQVLRL